MFLMYMRNSIIALIAQTFSRLIPRKNDRVPDQVSDHINPNRDFPHGLRMPPPNVLGDSFEGRIKTGKTIKLVM